MTKKFLLKLNMVIVFVVVLFAEGVFAESATEIANYLQTNNKLNAETGYANIGDFDNVVYFSEENNSMPYGSTLLIHIDKSTLLKIQSMGGKVFYSVDGYTGGSSLYIQDTNGDTAKITASNSGVQYDFKQVQAKARIRNGRNYEYKNATSLDDLFSEYASVEYQVVELTSEDALRNMPDESAYFFGLPTRSNSEDTKLIFIDTTGEIVDNDDNQQISPETEKVDVWSGSGSVEINESNPYIKPENNKWRYLFKADYQGTYKITINGEDNNYTHGLIGYTDLNQGIVKPVYGGAYIDSAASETGQNYVVLSAKDEYFWDFNIGENTTIAYEFVHSGIANENDLNPSTSLERRGVFEEIEKIFSDFVLSIARVLNWIVAMALGENVTIDMIVFNEYPDAKLEFFTTNIYGGDVETTSSLISSLRQPISTMYSMFRSLAIVGYLIILVYIGIKIMLSSTTAQKKAGYKETFLAWVTGLIILFFMPYYMKYTIALNDGLVNFVRKIPSVDNVRSQVTRANIDTSKGFIKTNFENAIDVGEGENAANDYMTTVYNLANVYGRLGYSIAYLVMSWQVIMLVVYYYKRAFIVAILIIIFPLIAFSYVWDKLNDGKSQALSSWIKEFTISVIVQAFHAVVFSFVVCTIYSSILSTTDSRGMANADFILLIIASKFLFEGEQILKQIFGGGGEVLGTAAQTGVRIAAITKLTTSVVGRSVNNVVGKNGAVRTGWRSFQGFRRDALLLKNRPDGTKVFDLLASTPARDRRVSALLPSEGEITPNIRRSAEVVDRLNNMHQNSDEVNAETLRMYRDLLDARRGKGPNKMSAEEAKQFDAMMKKSNLTKEQLESLNNSIMAATTAYIALGDNPTKEQIKQITKKLRMEIEAILQTDIDGKGNAKTSGKNARADLLMEAALRNMKEGISVDRNPEDVDKDFNNIYQNAKTIADKIHFANDDDIEKLTISAVERKNRAKVIFDEFKNNNKGMTKDERKAARAMARSLATWEQLISDDDKYAVTSTQAVGAIRRIENNRNLASAMMKHSNVSSVDVDTLRYVLAKKMTTEKTSISSSYAKTKPIVENRTQAMLDSYTKDNEEILNKQTPEKRRLILEKAREVAQGYAYLEFAGTGVNDDSISSNQLKTHLDMLASQDEELVDKMKKYSTLEYEISELRGDLSRTGGVNWGEEPANEWAQSVVKQMEEEAHERAQAFDEGSTGETDPYVTIINIIEAAQRGLGTINIGSLDELISNANNSEARQKVTDRKKRLSIAEQLKSRELGEIGLRLEGYEYRNVSDFTSPDNRRIDNGRERARNVASNIRRAVSKNLVEEKREIEQPTFEGYTLDEIRQRRNDNAWSAVNSVFGIVADTTIAPFTTMAGAAIGAAITDDGMPIEESFTGAMSGFKAGTFVSDKVIPKITREDSRAEERAEIQKKIKKRINDEQKARYKAQQAAEEAEEDAQRLDNTLIISGANAYLHIEPDGTLSATVNVRASNAEYISVDETPIIPSSGWEPYQESYYYVFKDKNPKADHNLYIYVRDRSGNVKGVRIEGIHQ